MTESLENDALDAPRPHFQKPLVYNRYLPYSELVDDEARILLQDIKVNLSVALQKRELWPGALYWTNRLSRYSIILFPRTCIIVSLLQQGVWGYIGRLEFVEWNTGMIS